jgi:hypothetical protein
MMFHSAARILRVVGTLAILLGTSACSEKLPDLTDDELIALIGDSRITSERRLTKKVVECVRLIGGLDREIYKDAPESFLGAVRVECRKDLDAKLKDASRNPKGAKLAHFEDPAVGERLGAIYERIQQEEALKAAEERKAKAAVEEEERRKAKEAADKRAAARRAEAEEWLAKTRSEVADLAGRMNEIVNAVGKDCQEWQSLRGRIATADKSSKWGWRFPPEFCGSRERENLRDEVVKAAQVLQAARVEEGDSSFQKPFLGEGSPDRIRYRLDRLARELAEIRVEALRVGVPVSAR